MPTTIPCLLAKSHEAKLPGQGFALALQPAQRPLCAACSLLPVCQLRSPVHLHPSPSPGPSRRRIASAIPVHQCICFYQVHVPPSPMAARQCGAGISRLLLLYHSPAAQCSSAAAELGGRAFSPSATGLGLQQLLRQAAASASAKQGFSSAVRQAEPVLRQRSPFRRFKSIVNDYKKLSKFRLSALVALTASAGYAAGSGDSIDYAQLAWTSLGTLGAAACANTLNQLYEVFNDSRMTRTMNRPLPAGRLSTRHARVFALLTGAAGLWVLAEKVGRGC